ncbi:serine/threonine protein kinase [Nocardioides euryhalodurans]|uniref:non-specific serine/threonine protein kinase n=1 Tax=Nocardioides euryhalodurans TaxID=2518370 RepID=A0A4P7GL92_9ACTN|nr:serine/threonine protein kinase [Nocardioides euryhalodurans]QBR92865.1 serine/threonine protein kinase [Nocardioides euryhalodurans]
MSEQGTERFADDARRYRLDSRIATGGMGEVWRASDTRLGRTVAVKLLKTEYADDATFRSRFSSEAQHAAALHHPGVAAVYDFGEASTADASDGTPRPYLVMELVDGQPLSALITPGRPMDPDATRDLMAQAADAIGAAHAAGIVHRDVKPANLLVTPDRRIKITDFGIARATEGMALTQTGQVMGTPQYLSPEQAQGGTATPASDVYSLGVVAFECLTSQRPFVGETPVATALAHLREPVPELPGDVPTDLARVVRRAMAKDPADRFPDAAAFAAALRDPATVALAPAVAAGATAPATQVLGSVAPVPPPGTDDDEGRRGLPWLWILLALAVLAAIVVLWLVADGDEEPTSQPQDRSPRSAATTQDSPTQESPTQSPETQETTPTEEPSETATESAQPETFDIDESAYVGRDVKDVEKELRDLGLRPVREELENDGTQTENAVDSVDPTTDLQEGDEVTVSYWGKAAPVPGPPETPPGQDQEEDGQ